MKTYFNDAIIGNKEVRCGLTDKGEIVRICYPNIDYRQFIEHLHMGVKVNDSGIIYLHNDVNNVYKQEYLEDTNILKTEIKNTYFNLRMEQTDFVSMTNNVIIRKYVFTNEHEISLDIKFLVHSKMLTEESNFVGAKLIEAGMLQYSHNYNMAIFSNELSLNSHKINGIDDEIKSGNLYDKDYIGMTNNSGISYEVGTLKPKETKEFSIMIYLFENNEKDKIEDLDASIDKMRKLEPKKEFQSTKKYWKSYLRTHITRIIEEDTSNRKNTNNIYKRTILLYPLLQNEKTGGIAAAMEVDENFSKCR